MTCVASQSSQPALWCPLVPAQAAGRSVASARPARASWRCSATSGSLALSHVAVCAWVAVAFEQGQQGGAANHAGCRRRSHDAPTPQAASSGTGMVLSYDSRDGASMRPALLVHPPHQRALHRPRRRLLVAGLAGWMQRATGWRLAGRGRQHSWPWCSPRGRRKLRPPSHAGVPGADGGHGKGDDPRPPERAAAMAAAGGRRAASRWTGRHWQRGW